MERKRIEKLIALLLVGILMPVSLFPFRIYADTISASNIHLNTSLISVNYDHSPNFYNYEYEFVFDKQYVGWVSVKVVSTYYSDNNFTQSQYTFTKAIYVNGGTASITNGFYSTGNFSGGCLVSASFSVVNSNVIEYSVINSLDQIIDILQDTYNYVSIDMIQELQSIVANTQLANDYLELISQYRQWDIPFESFSYVSWFLSRMSPFDYISDNSYIMGYPSFKVPKYSSVAQTYLNANAQCLIIFVSDTQPGLINNYIGFNAGNFTSTREYYNIGRGATGYLYLYKYIVTNNGANANYIVNVLGASPGDQLIIPILMVNLPYNNFSTDFALRFGLSNPFLDNIQTIANGTIQSNSASSSLDQTTSQFSDDANDLVTIEESFNNSMNQSLQSVNPTFNMGSSFLTSANWVSQQFNRIVNNTPFASLITFGLTLGLGLLIIGKVRK